MSYQGKKPENWECLLKEYELKYNYMIQMSNRLYQLFYVNLIVLAALLNIYFKKGEIQQIKYVISGIGIFFNIMLFIWISEINRRYNKRRKRVKYIGKELGIEGYSGKNKIDADKNDKKKKNLSIKLTPLIKSWLIISIIFWLFCLFA